MDIQYNTAFIHYKQMIHEIIHTAAHQNFVSYYESEAPEEIRTTLHEGVTDYFALKVWEDVANDFKKNKDTSTLQNEIQQVNAIVTQLKDSGLDQQARTFIFQSKEESNYKGQVTTIRNAVAIFKDGETRLQAAYFYGNVYHFFPHFNKEQSLESEKRPSEYKQTEKEDAKRPKKESSSNEGVKPEKMEEEDPSK